jgi:hypothetical protein
MPLKSPVISGSSKFSNVPFNEKAKSMKLKNTVSVLAVTLGLSTIGQAQSFLTDGLVAYYPFNNNLKDVAGGNDMSFFTVPPGLQSLATDSVYSTAPSFGVDRFGNAGNALIFNEVTGISYARSPNIVSPSIANTFTMTIWALSTSTRSVNWADNVLLMPTHGSVNYGPGNAGVGFIMNNDQVGLTGHSDNYAPVLLSTPVNSGLWHQVAVTCSAGVFRLFVDGNFISASDQSGSGYTFHSSSGDPYAQSEFWIPEGGGIGGMMEFNNVSGFLDQFYRFTGSVSDFRIYNRALSDTEVQQLYAYENQQPCRCPPGPKGDKGATGPQGPSGVGLVSGSVLFLVQGTTPPPSFTKIGTTQQLVKDLKGKPSQLQLDVYQMK